MKRTGVIISICFSSLPCLLNAQDVNDIIRQGNDLYKQQQYEPAKTAYDEALAKDSSNTVAKFNAANTAYRLSKANDAIKSFEELAAKYKNADEKAKAYYNKGVVLSSQKRLEESIEEYKNALRQDPNDKEARENLQKALLELKKRNPPPPKKQDQKKQQNKKQKEQPKMNQKEAEQKLKLLEQKEKELQQRLQGQKNKTGGSSNKDW